MELNATKTLTVVLIFTAIVIMCAETLALGQKPIAPANLIALVMPLVCVTPSLVNNSVSHNRLRVTVVKT